MTANLAGLNSLFAARLSAAIAAAEAATGKKASFNSGRRTAAQGVDIWSRATGGGRHAPSFPAARPGRSLHEQGMAVDIQPGPVLNWLHAHAKEYGLAPANAKRGFGWDPVHIQLDRSAPKTAYDATPSMWAGDGQRLPPENIPNVDQPPAAQPTSATLRKGMSGPAIDRLGQQLGELGYNTGSPRDQFGNQTAGAVRNLEKGSGGFLKVDRGVAGPQVQRTLADIGRAGDITSALRLAPPSAGAVPNANPLDIAFGRVPSAVPQDVATPYTGRRGTQHATRFSPGGSRAAMANLAAGPSTEPDLSLRPNNPALRIAAAPPPGYAVRGPGPVDEIAGSGGLTSGGPPSELAANPPAPLDAPGGPAWGEAPTTFAGTPYTGTRGRAGASRFSPGGSQAAMANIAAQADQGAMASAPPSIYPDPNNFGPIRRQQEDLGYNPLAAETAPPEPASPWQNRSFWSLAGGLGQKPSAAPANVGAIANRDLSQSYPWAGDMPSEPSSAPAVAQDTTLSPGSISSIMSGFGGFDWGGGGSQSAAAKSPIPAAVPNRSYQGYIPGGYSYGRQDPPQTLGYGGNDIMSGNAGPDRFAAAFDDPGLTPAGGNPDIAGVTFLPGGIPQEQPGMQFDAPSATPVYTPPRIVSSLLHPAQSPSVGAGLSAPSLSPSSGGGGGRSSSGYSAPQAQTASWIGNYLASNGVTPGNYVGATSPGYTAPNFNPTSGGAIYAYKPNGQGGGSYVDSHGNVHSY